jgi:hypothetical protein
VFEAEEKFQPRYVEVPALRERGFGKRNLVWGVIFLILAVTLLIAAVILSGQKAVLSLAACMLTLAALYVLSRMHIFRQRNGSFLAVSVVVMMSGAVALLDRGYEALAKVANPAPAPGMQQLAMVPPPRMVEEEPPLLMDAFALSRPDMSKPQLRVLKDSRVTIEDRSYRIKKGDSFPFVGMKDGDATFSVRDLQVSLPVGTVEILGGKLIRETKQSAIEAALAATATAPANPPPAAPVSVPAQEPAKPAAAEIEALTKKAQVEATRRYPALAIKGSKENEIYVSAYLDIKDSGDRTFFVDPEWPLLLADQLAKTHGWARGDQAPPTPVVPEGTAPVFDSSAPPVIDENLMEQLPPSTLDDLPVNLPPRGGRR